MVRVAAQELPDSVLFPVRQAQGPMNERREWLLRNLGQAIHRSRGNRRAPSCVIEGVARRNLGMLVALALIWGASFMFIKIADRQLAPSTLIMGRLGLAALTLAVLVPWSRATVGELRENAGWLVLV